jgi:uncharacterized Zn finger protein (UPF0148 family)
MSRRVFCPVCYQAYRLKLPREVRIAHYLQVSLLGLLLAGALYPWLGFRAWVVLPPLWILFELIFRLWKRMEMVCPHCDFDPVVYKRDPALAKERVKERMESLRNEVSKKEETLSGSQEQSESQKEPLQSREQNSTEALL